MTVDHETWSERQRSASVTVDGHDADVTYYEDGTGNDGPPVVFVHGIPTWSFLWRNVVDALAADRHVVAMDMVGYGNATMREGIDRSIRAQEQVLDGLLDHLEADGVSIVAHDIGGGVALRFAAHQPERVERLVLSNAVCYDSWPVSFVNGLGVPSTLDRDEEDLASQVRSAFEEGLHGDPADHEAFVEGMMAPWRSEGGWRSLVRDAVATNTNHTTEIDYGAITAETTLLWGADDVLQPIDYAERLAGDVAGDATVIGLEDAYHWVVEDRPDAYAEHLRDVFV
ncbi:MAG: alpha/beta fold hydrolase [Halanaeroarchaeum sp.]